MRVIFIFLSPPPSSFPFHFATFSRFSLQSRNSFFSICHFIIFHLFRSISILLLFTFFPTIQKHYFQHTCHFIPLRLSHRLLFHPVLLLLFFIPYNPEAFFSSIHVILSYRSSSFPSPTFPSHFANFHYIPYSSEALFSISFYLSSSFPPPTFLSHFATFLYIHYSPQALFQHACHFTFLHLYDRLISHPVLLLFYVLPYIPEAIFFYALLSFFSLIFLLIHCRHLIHIISLTLILLSSFFLRSPLST